jgi:hypothetical protein
MLLPQKNGFCGQTLERGNQYYLGQIFLTILAIAKE